MADKPLVEVRNLRKYFPVRRELFRARQEVQAVDDVSFAIDGETLGLVGESGCGKTTAAQADLRLIEPTAGRVLFDGQDMTALIRPQSDRSRRVQIVFQDPYGSLNPRMTPGTSSRGADQARRAAPRNASRAWRSSRPRRAWTRINRYPHEFSGGQRQRISIARACR